MNIQKSFISNKDKQKINKLKLLSISPDQQLSNQSKNNKYNSITYLNSQLLYQVYHHQNINKNQLDYLNPQRKTPKSKISFKHNASSNYLLQNTQSHKHYTRSKRSFQTMEKQRINNQKNLTHLSRTFNNVKKSQQKAKRQVMISLSKRLQKQQKQRQRHQQWQKHTQWLEKQKNQNHTKKYMNHLMKYQAKKTLQQRNSESAQKMRMRLKSQQSQKRQSLTNLARYRRQQAYLMKRIHSNNLNQARSRTFSRIKQRSDGLRNQMVKIYQCEGQLQAWRIGKIDQRSKFIAATIQNSRKNKDMMQNVLRQAQYSDSKALIQVLNQTISSSRTQRRVNIGR